MTPNVVIKIDAPSFPAVVVVGDTATGELVVTLESLLENAAAAIVRLPAPPPHGSFNWNAGDHILSSSALSVSVPVDFTPRGPGVATLALELTSNAQGSPQAVILRGTAKKGIVR